MMLLSSGVSFRVPHMRGDEPRCWILMLWVMWAFPTCVGMNRVLDSVDKFRHSVPHMRGDEPREAQEFTALGTRSPHAWG